MVVTLGADLLGRYRRFTLHNSPYVAHDAGRAVDLYPAAGAPSPVAGEVLDVRTVTAPSKPYAAAHDHLVLVAVDETASPVSWDGADDGGERNGGVLTGGEPTDEPLVARVLHVDPAVEPGDEVAVGDPLGRLVRSGFFARWVAPHLHVGFRAPGTNPYRASGSLPLAAALDVTPLPWDGTGTVVERGDTFAVLDAPTHPEPASGFVGVGCRVGDDDTTLALDGGLAHYDGGGVLGARVDGPVSLLGERVGVATAGGVAWDDVTVLLDDAPVTGLSLFAARDGRFGAKVVCPGDPPELGEHVAVALRSGE